MNSQDYVTANERLQHFQPKPTGLFKRLLNILSLREKKKSKVKE